MTSHEVNVTGFLRILGAVREAGIRRVVYASSSSVYGDHPGLPKVEDTVGRVLSPYAATKYADELYAHAFGDRTTLTELFRPIRERVARFEPGAPRPDRCTATFAPATSDTHWRVSLVHLGKGGHVHEATSRTCAPNATMFGRTATSSLHSL